MQIVLKCLSCNHTFQVPFKNNGYIVEQCPHCQNEIGRVDDVSLYNMTDRADFFSKHLRTVKLIKIVSDEFALDETTTRPRCHFQVDMDNLTTTYKNASPEAKQMMESIIDKVFLLINSDVVNGKIDKLNEVNAVLDALYLRRVEIENERMKRLLDQD